MKNWLLSVNVLGFFMLTLLACPSRPPANVTSPPPGQEMAHDTHRMHTDTSASIGTTTGTPSKEEQYKQGSGEKHEAPKHGTPDDMKLDSIKDSKKKKKG